MVKISGGEVLAKMLSIEGVDKVFGIIDGTYMGFYASLQKYGIELITPRHETTAVHMAGSYARLTGKLGVCMASNGPGAANALPGVAVENGEAHRVLLITSYRRTGITNPDRGGAYQYFNQTGVIGPMSKWSATAGDFSRIPEIVRRALRISFQGRPGVVHVNIPENIMNTKVKANVGFWQPKQYRKMEPIEPSDNAVAAAAKLLIEAKAPMIHAGTGVIHASAYEELLKIAELLKVPVATSWSGRATMPEKSIYSIPLVHLALNDKVKNESDLVLCLGSRMGETDWWAKAPYWALPTKQKVIYVDIDEESLGVSRAAALNVHGDIKLFLQKLIAHLNTMKPQFDKKSRTAILKKYEQLKKANIKKLADKHLKTKKGLIKTGFVPGLCQKVFGDDAIAVFDGGNTAVWANFFHVVKEPNSIVGTFKFGMLGAGLGQALGAKAAFPEKHVYCIIGDGAMGFHPQEIETSIRANLPVTFIVVADKQWGMVKLNQQFALKPIKTVIKKTLEPHETINADLGEIAWDKMAEAMGGHGERVDNVKDLEAALVRSKDSGTCSVIHVDVDPVTHMWAPGLITFKDMHAEPKGK